MKLLIDMLELNYAAAARISQTDPSIISRLCNNKRIPKHSNHTIRRICNALAVEAEKNGKSDIVHDMCEIYNTDLATCIEQWLIPNEPVITEQISKNKQALNDFAEKLNKLMMYFNISNAKLAKILAVDSSLISRMRNGSRIPNSDSQFVKLISSYFMNAAKNNPDRSIIEKDLGINIDELSEWLYDSSTYYPRKNQKIITSVDNILNNFHMIPKIHEGEIDINRYINDDIYGYSAMRSTVIKLLRDALEKGTAHDMIFYSDQSIKWLTEDSDFLHLWTDYMLRLLENGSKLKILYAFKNGSTEMTTVLESIIPIYLTGNVSIHYQKKCNGNHFNRIVFIINDVGYMIGNCVCGTEHEALYIYENDSEKFDYINNQMKCLLSDCMPLVDIYAIDSNYANSIQCLGCNRLSNQIKCIIPYPMVYFLSRDAFIEIITEAGLSGDAYSNAVFYYDKMREKLLYSLKYHPTTWIITLCSYDDIINGNSRFYLPSYIYSQDIYYSKLQYKKYLEDLLQLMSEYSNLKLQISTVLPMNYIRMMYKEKSGVYIIRYEAPGTVYIIKEQYLCEAFNKYIESVECVSDEAEIIIIELLRRLEE